MKQKQSAKEIPRTNDKRERFAFRLSAAEKRAVRRSGGAGWLRRLIRENAK
jgi:hypothetical protein